MSDREVVHYQPASKTTWCGALRRAIDANETNLAGIPRTTDVSKVTCPKCRRLICNVAFVWEKESANV